jgi:hypothetical protein
MGKKKSALISLKRKCATQKRTRATKSEKITGSHCFHESVHGIDFNVVRLNLKQGIEQRNCQIRFTRQSIVEHGEGGHHANLRKIKLNFFTRMKRKFGC